MHTSDVPSALAAALSTALALDLEAHDAVVLQDSNRLTLRLLPCDVLVRVAPLSYRAGAEFEVEVARRLAETGCPVAALEPRVEPRVYERDGFAINMWTYYEPVSPQDVSPAEYAQALGRLHRGMREIALPAPHFTDRIAEAQALIANRAQTPELGDADREFLSRALRELREAIGRRGAPEQLLHGEPHPGNVLRTKDGLLFIDFETCCRGPVEWDIAHYSRVGPDSWYVDAALPDGVAQHYPNVDRGLVRACWVTMLAIVTAWRCDRDDQFPDGRRMRDEWLGHVRTAVARYGFDASL